MTNSRSAAAAHGMQVTTVSCHSEVPARGRKNLPIAPRNIELLWLIAVTRQVTKKARPTSRTFAGSTVVWLSCRVN